MKTPEILVQEIKQIAVQYKAEVGSRRKPWPKAIIGRVQELITHGLTIKKISDATGIPYYSILNWRHRVRMSPSENKFHTLAVVGQEKSNEKSVTVTVPSEMKSKSATVTVTTPDGYQVKIEGEMISAFDFLKALRGDRCF